METEGVLQYRLLGSHPAASGRYYSYAFSGETVLVDIFLQDIVKQHRINLTRYKLEVSRLVNVDGERKGSQLESGITEKKVLCIGSFLHSYDRIVINVSQRHYLDAALDATQGGKVTHEDRLQNVEHLLLSAEEAGNLQTSSPSLSKKRNRGGDDEQQDPDAFIRVTALSNKAFPLLPCMRRRQSSVNALQLPKPTKGKCVLCELNCFKEVVLQCCGFSACRGCLELAKVMLVHDDNNNSSGDVMCVVCGVFGDGKKATEAACCLPAHMSVKREKKTCLNTVNNKEEKDRWCVSGGGTSSSAGGLSGMHPRAASRVTTFEAELTGNMARILSLLDVTDPLTKTAREKRRVSAVIATFFGK